MKKNTGEYFSAAQVSRELNVELSVLKKISYFVEKALKNKNYYYRNNKNQFLYNLTQMEEIERVIRIKRENKISYSAVIYMEFSNENSGIVSWKSNEKDDWFANMEMIISSQEQSIKKLTISMKFLENMENQNFESIRQIDNKIDRILNHVQISRVQNKKKVKKKKQLILINSELNKKALIRKKELKEMRNKIIYLPSIWNERMHKIEMSVTDKEYYTNYVGNAKKAYDKAIKNKKKLGIYYIISNESKETLTWYSQFYDYLAGN